MKKSSLVLFALLLSTGCAANTIEQDGFVLEKSKTEELLHDLQRRASFDFGCSSDQLRLTILAVHDDAGADMPKQVGVQGCDRRATYTMEFLRSFWGPGNEETGWRLDAAGIQAAR